MALKSLDASEIAQIPKLHRLVSARCREYFFVSAEFDTPYPALVSLAGSNQLEASPNRTR